MSPDKPKAPEEIKPVRKGGHSTMAEFQELMRARLEAKNKTAAVVTPASVADYEELPDSELVEDTEPTISFAEATKIIRAETRVKLDGYRELAMEAHAELGLIQALKDKGVVSSDDEYAALFDAATFTEKGLAAIISKITESRQNWQHVEPVFNPGHLSYMELVKLLFEDHKVQCISSQGETYSFAIDHEEQTEKIAAEMKKINPLLIKNLATLDPLQHIGPKDRGASKRVTGGDPEVIKAQRQAYKDAYDAAPVLNLKKPQVMFAMQANDLPDEWRSSIEFAQDTTKGRKFIDPFSDLIRFRTRLHENGSWSRKYGYEINYFPLYVTPEGRVVRFCYYDHSLKISLNHSSPGQVIAGDAREIFQ